MGWRRPENKARQSFHQAEVLGCVWIGCAARGLYLRTGFVGMAMRLFWHFVAVSYWDGIEILFQVACGGLRPSESRISVSL